MDEIVRHAACTCGALSLSVRGEPRLVGMCHCLACQRRTGSAFGAGAFFTREQISELSGARSTYSRKGESGANLTFNFCPNCGSNVFWERDNRLDLVAVALGAFADPGFPAPSRASWAQSMHPWLATVDEIESHPAAPT
jgi:hypothetical protein